MRIRLDEIGWLEYEVEGNVMYIMDIHVRKEYRGQGYGKQLLKKAIEVARKEGCTEIRMDVGNPVMEHIARKFGFVEDGTESDVGKGVVLYVWDAGS